MTMSPEFRDYLLDMLRPLGAVAARAMFGGGGLYLDGQMFALIFDDTLYLKADGETKGDFEARGMEPFTYEIEGRPGAVEMSYWEAPPELLDDADELCTWAGRAWQAAKRASTKKKSRVSAGKKKHAVAGKRSDERGDDRRPYPQALGADRRPRHQRVAGGGVLAGARRPRGGARDFRQRAGHPHRPPARRRRRQSLQRHPRLRSGERAQGLSAAGRGAGYRKISPKTLDKHPISFYICFVPRRLRQG